MSRALGRYELLRPLARGGMAEVYLARRRAAGVEKWLVVKRIRPERSGDVRFLDLFVREARLSMSLTHQNIVPVFDFGRIDDQVFLAMERIEGKDLGSTLHESGARPLPPLTAAFIASECCQALDYAHRRKSPEGAALGIVHRDVTPRNVLLSWSGEVKLTDFGIAALAGDDASKLIGTPAYMAPEQARGEPVDARADVYAIGLVLRELLTGQRARDATERDAMLEAARAGTLGPWPATDVPAALRAVVDRATAPAAADRFDDARAMLAALDDFIVAERAANRSEAPARLVATWLGEVWEGKREDPALEGEVGGDHLVSFLDDGALDVIGTGTQRSIAATAADDAAPPEAPEAPAELDRARSEAEAEAPPALVEATGGRGRAWWLFGGLAAAAVAATALVVGARQGQPSTAASPEPSIPTHPTTATPPPPSPSPAAATPPPSAPAVVIAPAVVDDGGASPEPPPSPTATAAATVRPRPTPTRPPRARPEPTTAPAPPIDPTPASATLAPRKVTINATPWAYFTIDTDPTRHETIKVLRLAPGPHRVHFTNPVLGIERTVTLRVPTDRDLTHVERLDQGVAPSAPRSP